MSPTESLGDLVVIHPLDPEDAPTIAFIRTAARTQKGARWTIDARKQYDALMEGVLPRARRDIRIGHGRRRPGRLGASCVKSI